MAFEPGRPTEPTTLFTQAGAATTGLPKGVAENLLAIHERAENFHRQVPTSQERQELGTEKQQAIQRLDRLLAHPHDGGFGLGAGDVRVVEQQRRVEELTVAKDRIDVRYQHASQAFQAAARVRTNADTFIRDRPGGTVLQDFEGSEPKLNGKESLLEAIERLRRRGRELKADLHRIESAPMPSSYARERMRAQVEALAVAPNLSLLIEHADGNILWPQANLRAQVFNADRAVAFTEAPDALALLAWTFKDALIARLDALISEEADDAAALSIADRERQAAEVAGDLLAVERDECALIWQGQAQGLPCEHRADCSAQAILGAALVTVPVVEQRGSSPERSGYSLVGKRR